METGELLSSVSSESRQWGAGVQFPTHSSFPVASPSISRVILSGEHREYRGPDNKGCDRLYEIETARLGYKALIQFVTVPQNGLVRLARQGC